MKIENTHFIVNGLKVSGRFHKPETSANRLPVVVMMNGFGTEWQFGTSPFIKAFTDMGCATFNFDYRHFGESEGTPRQLLDIPAQIEDCRAAIEHVLTQIWVDTDQLVLWGSSLGGGHAILMAAEFNKVKALVAQVPHCCSRAAMKQVKLSAIMNGMFWAMVDGIGSIFGMPTKLLPIVAEPTEYGVMNHPYWKEHYLSLAKNSTTWRNAIPARSLIKGGDYRPLLSAPAIVCPVFMVAAKNDAGVPLHAVEATAKAISQAQLYCINGDHFDVYEGAFFNDVLEKEVAFIKANIHF